MQRAENTEEAPRDVALPEIAISEDTGSRESIAERKIIEKTSETVICINDLSARTFRTRGGRMGSGMGLLLEGLWGYFTTTLLAQDGLEIAWLPDNQYNDYACVNVTEEWDPDDPERSGELLRIEAKSMNLGAEESKGHFDELQRNIGSHDLLLVLVWRWEPVEDGRRYSPQVTDFFLGSALRVAKLRDALHIARGGSFVNEDSCPDGCLHLPCSHTGEPINANGVRERRTGPEALRGGGRSDYAANFGGLVRMLKCSNPEARAALRALRSEDEVAHRFISFIHRNLPQEELNSYVISEWRTAYKATLGSAPPRQLNASQLRDAIAAAEPAYQDALRALFA